MISPLLILAVLISVSALLLWLKRRRDRNEIDRYSISPEELHALLGSGKPVQIFDVRQPLDLLAHSQIIPGSQRIPPDDILANPKLIPADQVAVIYCTCPSDRTSRRILHYALAQNFSHIKFSPRWFSRLAGARSSARALRQALPPRPRTLTLPHSSPIERIHPLMPAYHRATPPRSQTGSMNPSLKDACRPSDESP